MKGKQVLLLISVLLVCASAKPLVTEGSNSVKTEVDGSGLEEVVRPEVQVTPGPDDPDCTAEGNALYAACVDVDQYTAVFETACQDLREARRALGDYRRELSSVLAEIRAKRMQVRGINAEIREYTRMLREDALTPAQEREIRMKRAAARAMKRDVNRCLWDTIDRRGELRALIRTGVTARDDARQAKRDANAALKAAEGVKQDARDALTECEAEDGRRRR